MPAADSHAQPAAGRPAGPAPAVAGGYGARAGQDEHHDREQRDARLAALLVRVAAGDGAAFEQFFDATAGYARALGRRLLRDADLEDALADAYFDAWRHAADFDARRGSPVAWLLTMVHHRAIDLMRRRPAATAVDDAAAEGLEDPAPDPAERLWRCESQQQLQDALAMLSAAERWVLGLAYFRDLSHSAIADATGMPLGSVKSLINRAQHKLRKHLAR